MEILGQKIRELRTEKGMKQSELGAAIGVSQNTISGWELATKLPDIYMIIKIADFFDVSIDYLVGRED